jgi:8-oxo-dGTP diphosphatase
MKFESKLMESEDDNRHHDKQTPRASAYGGVLMRTVKRTDGTTYDQILLREVANHFGGYVWTYAKGRQDPGDTPTQTALREVMEETGYHARIVKLLKDEKDQVSMFGGDTSTTVFYLMHPKGDESCKPAAKFGWETQQIKWVSKEEAAKMIQLTTSSTGKRRDAQILVNAFAVYHPTDDSTYLESDLGD